jgi:hypothetical protein
MARLQNRKTARRVRMKNNLDSPAKSLRKFVI